MAVVIFWEPVGEDRGRVSMVHHKPERLSAERRAEGLALDFLPEPPAVDEAAGESAALYVTPSSGALDWVIKRPARSISVVDFLLRLPAPAVIAARKRRADDETLDYFIWLLEMAKDLGQPVSVANPKLRAGVEYLVALGLLTEEQAEAALAG